MRSTLDKVDLYKYKKIFGFIQAQDIMNKSVIMLTQDKKVRDAREIMRAHRFSGIPIVTDLEEKKLAGIISIENIIKCLETNQLDLYIYEVMTKKVKFFYPEDTFDFVIDVFRKLGYGRYPVINHSSRVIGIISRGDLLGAILLKFDSIYLHDKRREEKLASDVDLEGFSCITGQNTDNKSCEFTYPITTNNVEEAGTGSASLKKYLQLLNYPEDIIRKVSISTYEAEVNVVIHSGSHGEITAHLDKNNIIIRVEDHGKGIEDIEMALQEGFSTASEKVREMGFGAGMGLPNIKRFSDKLVILSEKNKGTLVEMRFNCESMKNNKIQNEVK